uniref:Secreted protein n=1 Tax=Macrostomum lignano TaxID=282301 RepID=A0A1I8HFJ6_9PLAT
MMQSVNANRLCFLLAWLLLASGEFLFTDALSCLQSNDLFKLSELNNVIAGKMAPKKCSTFHFNEDMLCCLLYDKNIWPATCME